MKDDYQFILRKKNGKKEVFGRSRILHFAKLLPTSEVHVVDIASRRSLGYMPIGVAKRKFI
jgi:hypothetical protein